MENERKSAMRVFSLLHIFSIDKRVQGTIAFPSFAPYTVVLMTHEDIDALRVEHNENGEVTITGDIPFSDLEKYRTHAIAHVGENVTIKGFRSGHIPENILIAHVGEMVLLEDMARHAIEEWYPKIIEKRGLDVIGFPKIGITKLAKDNPLGITIVVSVVPHVNLPEYKKIAHEENKNSEHVMVTDEDVDAQIHDILRQKVAYERLQKKATKGSGDDMKNDENTDTPPLPELTDELVKTLGSQGQFENVDDFKSKIKEHLLIQKTDEQRSKKRARLTDAILDKAEVKIPQILIDAELDQMFAQMEHDLKRAELSLDSYLTHIKKTQEDLRHEWTPNAEKRAKLQLILNAIAEKEHIDADSEAVEKEVSLLLKEHPNADVGRVRTYVTSVLINNKVMEILENA